MGTSRNLFCISQTSLRYKEEFYLKFLVKADVEFLESQWQEINCTTPIIHKPDVSVCHSLAFTSSHGLSSFFMLLRKMRNLFRVTRRSDRAVSNTRVTAKPELLSQLQATNLVLNFLAKSCHCGVFISVAHPCRRKAAMLLSPGLFPLFSHGCSFLYSLGRTHVDEVLSSYDHSLFRGISSVSKTHP